MTKDQNSNIVHADFLELEKLGYKKVNPVFNTRGICEFPPVNSLLCLTNKAQDMWVELSLADIKHSKVTPDKFLILNK